MVTSAVHFIPNSFSACAVRRGFHLLHIRMVHDIGDKIGNLGFYLLEH